MAAESSLPTASILFRARSALEVSRRRRLGDLRQVDTPLCVFGLSAHGIPNGVIHDR